MVFLAQITTVAAVQLVEFFQQFIGVVLVVVDLVGELCLLFEEARDIGMEQFCVIEGFFSPADLFRLALLLDVVPVHLQRRTDDIPVLENSDAVVFAPEKLRHHPIKNNSNK